jgi:preprotein translocase subunit SecG
MGRRCLDAGQSIGSPLIICWHFPELRSEVPMMDVVMVVLAVGFFALSIAYVYACEQL